MAFGICRIRNIKMEDISSTDKHNARLYESEEEYPDNINPQGHNVSRYILSGESMYKDETNLSEAIKHRLEENKVSGIRKNTNVAIEYVLAISDQEAWTNYNPSGWFAKCEEWLEERHGKGSVVAMSEHFDESNPHCHFIVVPLITKEVKWKNSKGSGMKEETRIDTRSYTGGGDLLTKLQTEYFEFCKMHEAAFGVPIYRGTKAEDQTRVYTQQTNHEIGKLRKEVDLLKNNDDALTQWVKNKFKVLKSLLLGSEQAKIDLTQIVTARRDKNKNGYWQKKGAEENYFHDKELPSPKAKNNTSTR